MLCGGVKNPVLAAAMRDTRFRLLGASYDGRRGARFTVGLSGSYTALLGRGGAVLDKWFESISRRGASAYYRRPKSARLPDAISFLEDKAILAGLVHSVRFGKLQWVSRA